MLSIHFCQIFYLNQSKSLLYKFGLITLYWENVIKEQRFCENYVFSGMA